MPIARKEISKDFINQIKSNTSKEAFEAEPTVEQTPVISKPVQAVQVPVEDKKEKYADVMNIRLSKGRRNEIKAFCSSCGVSVTQYIETSFEFLANEVAEGRIVISKGGIKRVE